MGTATGKRRHDANDPSNGPALKKSKGGNARKWKTPHQETKIAARIHMGTTLQVGDEGIWVTFARGMMAKAKRELIDLCGELAEHMYSIKAPTYEPAVVEEDDKGDADTEALVAKELEAMERASRKLQGPQIFTIIPAGIECVFFLKTIRPVDPLELVQRICTDASRCTDLMQRKTRYINRLTPVTNLDKASENGIERAAKAVLTSWFALAGPDEGTEGKAAAEFFEDKIRGGAEEDKTDRSWYSYAIRPTVRSHEVFSSGDIIKRIAGLVDQRHPVKLDKPDKVILVEVFQTFCGISVVDGKEWEELRRFNVTELHKKASETTAAALTGEI